MSRKAIGFTVAAIAAALSVVPAAAGHAESTTSGGGTFELSISQPGLEGLNQVTLTCDPTGGNHPRADEACDQLLSHSGVISEIDAGDQLCTMNYQPVTVRAEGVWQGRHETYSHEFNNKCVALRQTGGVMFDF